MNEILTISVCLLCITSMGLVIISEQKRKNRLKEIEDNKRRTDKYFELLNIARDMDHFYGKYTIVFPEWYKKDTEAEMLYFHVIKANIGNITWSELEELEGRLRTMEDIYLEDVKIVEMGKDENP